MIRKAQSLTFMGRLCLSLPLLFILSPMTQAQWTNHYQKLDDFGHHVYLEQHELPILAHGITDPAPSPDGKQIVFSSKGWLWLMDLDTQIARRITKGAGSDARARWSPDGTQIAFVRDYGNDTAVVIKNLVSSKERIINSPAIELDPEFSSDGQKVFYSSGEAGSIDVYQHDITTENTEKLVAKRQVERNVRKVANSNRFIYLHGNGAHRVLRQYDMTSKSDEIVVAQTLTYHLSADTHPSLNLIVYSAPIDNDYHLYTMDLKDPRVKHRLTEHGAFATSPSFSADGEHIFFVSLNDDRQFELMRIPTYGGNAEHIKVKQWEYGQETSALTLNITDDMGKPVTARVSIQSAAGHPVASPSSATFVDPQTGRHYFYIDGKESLSLPAGNYQIEAVRGPLTPVTKTNTTLREGHHPELSIQLGSLWDAKALGYVSADFHVHLNGDGHHRANHADALLLMRGENLEYLAPMSWNRWERRIDANIVGKHTHAHGHQVVQGQEVRSHFHGHIGLLNVEKAFVPWFFGPNNPTLGNPDLSNADVFAYANEVGAFGTYVHPIATDENPFLDENIESIPLELVSDGVLENKMGLELVCAWTSSLGTSQLWYRFLNIGQAVSGISGTDAWVDFHRTPAIGTARAYVRPDAQSEMEDKVVAAAIAGRSFLSTGPALMFALDNGARPGDVTTDGAQAYTLTVASTNTLAMVEIIVNGQVVESLEGLSAGESKTYSGTVNLPADGWVAARAYSESQQADSWPTMHARPFAHSSPIWINHFGSSEQSAKQQAAVDLLKAINAAENRAKRAYGEQTMPKLYNRFEDARRKLKQMIE